jgi:hypothetical protein
MAIKRLWVRPHRKRGTRPGFWVGRLHACSQVEPQAAGPQEKKMKLFLLDAAGDVIGEYEPPRGKQFESPQVLRVRERYFARCTDGYYRECSGLDATPFSRIWHPARPLETLKG